MRTLVRLVWLTLGASLLGACSEENAALSVPVDFKLTNGGDQELYIQLNGQTSGPAYFQLSMQGRSFRASPACETCLCEACARGQCAVCLSIPQVQRIGPGESFDFTWSGAEYVLLEDGCRQAPSVLPCLDRRGVRPGPITAELTYSRSAMTNMSGAPGMSIGPRLMKSVVFRYPDERLVQITLP